MKISRATSRKVVALCGVLILLALRVFPSSPYFLWRFERDFRALPHPARSKLVETGRAVASHGNGKECEFFDAQLRSYSSDRTAIRGFYRFSCVAVPYDSNGDFHLFKTGKQPVKIEFLPSPLPIKYHASYGIHENWNLSRWAGRRNLYIVFG